MSTLKDIGNPIQLNQSADPRGRITNKVRNYMSKIDLIPVKFTLKVPNLQEQIKDAVKYDFDNAIATYKKNYAQYGLTEDVSGVRIWSTTDTQIQEDISNTFETNIIEDKLNSFFASKQSMQDFAKSTGMDISGIADIITDTTNSATGGVASGAVNTATGLIVEGKHISLPKIWKNSSYAPVLNLNVRLVSPYGSPKSIKKHVLEPLIYLLALGTPTSPDGISYGNVGYVRINAYGISNINLGYIENISMVRGGSDMTFNKFSQPLFVDLNISIRSAFDGFAMVENENVSVNTIEIPDGAVIMDNRITSGITSVGTIIKSFQQHGSKSSSIISTGTSFGSDVFSNTVSDLRSAADSVTDSLSSIFNGLF